MPSDFDLARHGVAVASSDILLNSPMQMSATMATSSTGTTIIDKELSDFKSSILYLDGDLTEMPDETSRLVVQHLKNKGQKNFCQRLCDWRTKAQQTPKRSLKTHYQREGFPYEELKVGRFAYAAIYQILLVEFPGDPGAVGNTYGLLKYKANHVKKANGTLQSQKIAYEVWKPISLQKGQNDGECQNVFRLTYLNSIPRARTANRSKRLKLIIRNTRRCPTEDEDDENEDEDEPLMKRRRLNLLEKTGLESTLPQGLVCPSGLSNGIDLAQTPDTSEINDVSHTEFEDTTVLPEGNAEEAPPDTTIAISTRTAPPVAISERAVMRETEPEEQVGFDNEINTDQITRQEPIDIADNGDNGVKIEHPIHPLSVSMRDLADSTTSTNEWPNHGAAINHSGPGTLRFYGQADDAITTMYATSGRTYTNTYETVKFAFYNIDRQKSAKEVPFCECSSASMLKDAALEHDSITDDTRMFIIRIGDAPETKMRVNVPTSFTWKIIEPLNEILSNDATSPLIIHVSGMTIQT